MLRLVERSLYLGLSVMCILVLYGTFTLRMRNSKHRTPRVASVAHISGEVKHQRVGEMGWAEAGLGKGLRLGDLLYVSRDSEVHIEFDSGDRLMLNGERMLTVEERPSVFSSLRQVFSSQIGLTDSGKNQAKQSPRQFLRLFAPHTDKTRHKEIVVEETESNRTILVRYVRNRPVTFPKRGGVIWADSYPFYLNISIADSANPNQHSIAYLWSLLEEREPIWSHLVLSNVIKVPISRPGQYIFQVVSEDESEATRPLDFLVYKDGSEASEKSLRSGGKMDLYLR